MRTSQFQPPGTGLELQKEGFGAGSTFIWQRLDHKPREGRELSNTKLAAALQHKQQAEFSAEDWDKEGYVNTFTMTHEDGRTVDVSDLQMTDFIRAGDSYFRPTGKPKRRVEGKVIIVELRSQPARPSGAAGPTEEKPKKVEFGGYEDETLEDAWRKADQAKRPEKEKQEAEAEVSAALQAHQ